MSPRLLNDRLTGGSDNAGMCRSTGWLGGSAARLGVVALLALPLHVQPAVAASRVKDIADFEGVRTNMLVGYGLVVGLNGTGDSLRNSMFTQESLVAMLERLGVSTRGNALNTKNVAAVMVTATLPPFARQGSRIDVAVSSLGDSKSLLGGTLLVTPLLGADGEAYAVAQGPLSVSGFEARGDAETVTRGVPTAARIPAGAIVEREVPFQLASLDGLGLGSDDAPAIGAAGALLRYVAELQPAGLQFIGEKLFEQESLHRQLCRFAARQH